MNWVSQELEHTKLGDKRRERRLEKIVEDLAGSAESSVPLASRDGVWQRFDTVGESLPYP
jgi:hypothetical protein